MKIYIIKLKDGKEEKEKLQRQIDAANKFACDQAKLDENHWMRNWRGPLIYEDIDENMIQNWIQCFTELGGTIEERKINTVSPTKVVECQLPSEIIKVEDGNIESSCNDMYRWKAMIMCQFSHFTVVN